MDYPQQYQHGAPHQQLRRMTVCASNITPKLVKQTRSFNFKHLSLPPLVHHDSPLVVASKNNAVKDETIISGLSTCDALKSLQSFVDKIDTLFLDAGNCAASATHYLTFLHQCRSSIALGMGGMGYAICAGIGAQFCHPNSRSMVICGDGAFLITGMEIHTAIEHKLPVLWVIFNDAQHGMCTSRQRHFFDSRLTSARYNRPNFNKVVEGLAGEKSLWHSQAHCANDIDNALTEYYSLPEGTPGVLELVITAEEVPPFFPLAQADTNNSEAASSNSEWKDQPGPNLASEKSYR